LIAHADSIELSLTELRNGPRIPNGKERPDASSAATISCRSGKLTHSIVCNSFLFWELSEIASFLAPKSLASVQNHVANVWQWRKIKAKLPVQNYN